MGELILVCATSNIDRLLQCVGKRLLHGSDCHDPSSTGEQLRI